MGHYPSMAARPHQFAAASMPSYQSISGAQQLPTAVTATDPLASVAAASNQTAAAPNSDQSHLAKQWSPVVPNSMKPSSQQQKQLETVREELLQTPSGCQLRLATAADSPQLPGAAAIMQDLFPWQELPSSGQLGFAHNPSRIRNSSNNSTTSNNTSQFHYSNNQQRSSYANNNTAQVGDISNNNGAQSDVMWGRSATEVTSADASADLDLMEEEVEEEEAPR